MIILLVGNYYYSDAACQAEDNGCHFGCDTVADREGAIVDINREV
jgi:hypothetical protein